MKPENLKPDSNWTFTGTCAYKGPYLACFTTGELHRYYSEECWSDENRKQVYRRVLATRKEVYVDHPVVAELAAINV